jgi:hypothetical protein
VARHAFSGGEQLFFGEMKICALVRCRRIRFLANCPGRESQLALLDRDWLDDMPGAANDLDRACDINPQIVAGG